MTQRLTITLQEKGKKPRVVFDADVADVNLDVRNDWQEIRSNPAMFAALAGAPPEEILDLPGEQVAMTHSGSEIEVTYRMRFRADNAKLTDFRPAH